MARYSMQIALSAREMARSWLVEHYRRQGNPPMRTMIAVMVVLTGAAMLHRAPSVVAWIALGWGCFLLLRPWGFALLLLVSRRPAKAFEVTVDDEGVNIAGEKGARLIPWKDITATGLGTDYLWYEVRRGPRATIPFRVMEDRAALEALFRARVARAPAG